MGEPSKRHSITSDQDHENDFEQESGRATRARTRLIVEGFSNLALIATFFAGVQAQLISVTNTENAGPIAIATNAAFFGGLIFSVFTAVLATLSARWFSILREDDADYLSSRWLSQDSKYTDPALLEQYLEYQIASMDRIRKGRGRVSPHSRPNSQFLEKQSQLPEKQPQPQPQGFNPVHFDAECIFRLLRKERGYEDEGGYKDLEKGMEQQTQAGSQGDAASLKRGESATAKPDMPKSTVRERILSYVLLSPLIACLPSFALFTTGIVLLAWDRQPLAVAIFTSITVLICIIPLCGFFIKHRHKHVISHIYLGRPSL